MNIFVSNPCPIKSAQFLDSKRLIKMVLETCQLLSTCMNATGGMGPYKTTHINHPCTIWSRKSKGNYKWLLNHFEALLNEYTLRYSRIHKCASYFDILKEGINTIPDGDQTLFVNCTPFKDETDVYKAYNMCLAEKWKNDKRPPTWRLI